jgi:hypothetical protein
MLQTEVSEGIILNRTEYEVADLAAFQPTEVFFRADRLRPIESGLAADYTMDRLRRLWQGEQDYWTGMFGLSALGLADERPLRLLAHAYSIGSSRLRLTDFGTSDHFGFVLDSLDTAEIRLPRILSASGGLRFIRDRKSLANMTKDRSVYGPILETVKRNGFAETVLGLLLVGCGKQDIETIVSMIRTENSKLLGSWNPLRFGEQLSSMRNLIDSRTDQRLVSLGSLVRDVRDGLVEGGLEFGDMVDQTELISVNAKPYCLFERVASDASDSEQHYASVLAQAGFLGVEPALSYRFATDVPERRNQIGLRRVVMLEF